MKERKKERDRKNEIISFNIHDRVLFQDIDIDHVSDDVAGNSENIFKAEPPFFVPTAPHFAVLFHRTYTKRADPLPFLYIPSN